MGFSINEWSMRAFLRYKTWRQGERIGSDAYGNLYYRDRRAKEGQRERRWVVFNGGESEASRVPPEWHAWLHHQSQTVPEEGTARWRRPWQQPPSPNQTGTPDAYLPPGDVMRGSKRSPATGDYEPWTPS